MVTSHGSVEGRVTEQLPTPQNSAPVVTDYQPSRIWAATSMDAELLVSNIVRSQIADRTGIERLSQAGAVPTTPTAVVTELFGDWASLFREPSRDIISWYFTQGRKRTGEVGAPAAEKLAAAAH